jgi:hypothetical protein
MPKDNPSDIATWTGQAHYLLQKRSDVGSMSHIINNWQTCFLNNIVGVVEYEATK